MPELDLKHVVNFQESNPIIQRARKIHIPFVTEFNSSGLDSWYSK
jgi:hypothetical protein